MICGFIKKKKSEKNGEKLIKEMLSSLSMFSRFKTRSFGFGKMVLGVLSFDSSFRENIYCDEKGTVVAFDGYLLDIKSLADKKNQTEEDSVSPPKLIYNLYKDKGFSFIDELNGVFNIIVYNFQKDELYLINDRYGMKPLFYYADSQKFVFASEVKAIIKDQAIKKEINWQSWGEYFSLKYLLGDKTFFNNIFRLPNATILEYKDKKASLGKYWDYQNIEVDHSHTDDFFTYKIKNRLVKSIKKFNDNLQNISCLLSGGYDSRCLVFLLKRVLHANMVTYTTEHPTGKTDAELARKVARMIKVRNIYKKNPGNMYAKYLVKKIYLLDGMCQEHIWLMPLFEKINRNIHCNFDGLAGDLFLKGLFLTSGNLKNKNNNRRLADILYNDLVIETRPLFKYFSPEAVKGLRFSSFSIKKLLDKIGNTENKITIFFAQNRTKNTVALASSSITGRIVTNKFPFLENDLVASALSVPPEIKITKDIYLQALEVAFPDFKTVPTTNDTAIKNIFLSYSLGTLSILGLLGYLKLLHRLYYIGRTLSSRDKMFLLDLADCFRYPKSFKKEAYLKDIELVRKKKRDFDGFMLNSTEFLIWHNLFFVENKKIYSFINNDYRTD